MTVRLLSTEKGDTYWGAEGGRDAGRQFVFGFRFSSSGFIASSTFTECGDGGPVGGGAAHVVGAGGSQLIG